MPVPRVERPGCSTTPSSQRADEVRAVAIDPQRCGQPPGQLGPPLGVDGEQRRRRSRARSRPAGAAPGARPARRTARPAPGPAAAPRPGRSAGRARRDSSARDDVVLGPEVVVQRGLGDPRRGRDRLHGAAAQALVGERPGGTGRAARRACGSSRCRRGCATPARAPAPARARADLPSRGARFLSCTAGEAGQGPPRRVGGRSGRERDRLTPSQARARRLAGAHEGQGRLGDRRRRAAGRAARRPAVSSAAVSPGRVPGAERADGTAAGDAQLQADLGQQIGQFESRASQIEASSSEEASFCPRSTSER